jgi:hypothetical protein
MKKLLRLALGLAMIPWVTGVGNAEEIVFNKMGQAILLKDDGKWEFKKQNTSGKVVWSIMKAQNNYRADVVKDNFGEIDYYTNLVGCDYVYSVHNNTDKKVKLADFFYIGSTAKFLKTVGGLHKCSPLNHCVPVSNYSADEILSPGSIMEIPHQGLYQKNPAEPLEGLYVSLGKSKNKIPENKLNNLYKKYGCDAQKNTIYLMKHTFFMADSKSIITFSKSEGIKPKDTHKYIEIGAGVYPLKKSF